MRYLIIPLAIILYILGGYMFIMELNTDNVSFLSAVFASCTFTASVFAIGYYILNPLIRFIIKHW